MQMSVPTCLNTIGMFEGPRNATSSEIALCRPNLSRVRSPLGPSAILAPISRSSLALSYNATSIKGCVRSAIAAVSPAIPQPTIATWSFDESGGLAILRRDCFSRAWLMNLNPKRTVTNGTWMDISSSLT